MYLSAHLQQTHPDWQKHQWKKNLQKYLSLCVYQIVTHSNLPKGETVSAQNETIRMRRNKNIESIINLTCYLAFVRSISFHFKQKTQQTLCFVRGPCCFCEQIA